MRLIFILLFISCLRFTGKAQVLNYDTLSIYTQSVVLRVYDVGVRVPLTVEEQLTLANLFQAEENDLFNGVRDGKPVTWLDSTKTVYLNTFNVILAPSKRDTFYHNKALERSEVLSALTAKMLKRKYNTDDVMEQHFTTLYNWKEQAVEKIWMASSDTAVRNANLLHTIIVYDTLISKYIRAAAGSQYLARRLYVTDSLIAIDSVRKSALARSYIFNCMQHKSMSYADNFDKAFNSVFNLYADTGVYAIVYNADIIRNTELATTSSMASYVKQDHLSAYTLNEIIPLIVGREREIAIINKIFPNYNQHKDSLINTIFQKYQPEIDSIIGFDAHLYALSQIEVAIRFAYELELTIQQVSDLQDALSELRNLQEQYHQEDPLGEYDSRFFESEKLNEILSAEQYTEVLIAKYQGKAKSWAQFDWIAMLDADIASHYDSAAVHLELYNYHLAVLIAYYRNGNNAEEQYISVSRINEVMPAAKRELLELWEYQTPYADLPDTFFQW